ncbi:MAG: presenilin family intramembrane aspartyl protease [Candidatus Pacearchaeota archaeon]|nr:presenilin family intramembrane aspartyl protease [Candidatus Pacearchaeota archaeon]
MLLCSLLIPLFSSKQQEERFYKAFSPFRTMKHSIQITLVMLAMFLISQFIGILIINSYDSYFGKTAQQKVQEGKLVQPEISIVKETVPPEMEFKKPIDILSIVISIVVAIVIASVIFFLLSKIKITLLIKVWFSFVVFICLTLAITLLIYPILGTDLFVLFGKNISLAETIAAPLALVLTFYKIIRRNIIIHNLTELFIYPGLAVMFLPLVNVIVALILLLAISIYDIIAVWKTQYMINLAKFQISYLKIFTGFFLPYLSEKDKVRVEKLKIAAQKEVKKRGKKFKRKKIKVKVHFAALGGGDVAFPMIFAGTILVTYGLLASIITVLCTTLALALLFLFSEKGKMYPAMPFLSAGCFLGLILILLFL